MTDRIAPELEELHALVDGQLAPEARRQVREHLAADPLARRRVEDYRAIRDGLRALFDPVLDEPVPVRLTRVRAWPRWSGPLGAMAAGVVLLVSGGFVGVELERHRLLPAAGGPELAQAAAMAYAVYTPEVRHPVEVPGDQEQHLVTWLTKRLGTQVSAPRLDGLGFHLLGGRLLASETGPGALLMYEDAQGRRIVLNLSISQDQDQHRTTAFRFVEESGVAVFYWIEGPLAYALAGDLERPQMLALAEAVYQQTAI
jgi:anti-sigma factor RsiW